MVRKPLLPDTRLFFFFGSPPAKKKTSGHPHDKQNMWDDGASQNLLEFVFSDAQRHRRRARRNSGHNHFKRCEFDGLSKSEGDDAHILCIDSVLPVATTIEATVHLEEEGGTPQQKARCHTKHRLERSQEAPETQSSECSATKNASSDERDCGDHFLRIHLLDFPDVTHVVLDWFRPVAHVHEPKRGSRPESHKVCALAGHAQSSEREDSQKAARPGKVRPCGHFHHGTNGGRTEHKDILHQEPLRRFTQFLQLGSSSPLILEPLFLGDDPG